ncbi:granulocyte colony-stimulating factor receptor isoform X3 [Nelusetta ayraudi]
MISMRLTVIIMLVAFASRARSEGAAGPCAWVRASSSVVPLGSPVTVTCEVSEGCHLFSQRDLHLDWRLENRLIPDGVVATESGRLSRIVIPNFNYTRAFLVCLARGSPSQVVGGLQIRAGYPPTAAQNISCQTNLSFPNTLVCRWDPSLQETYLATRYSLHTEIGDLDQNHSYELPPGVHRYNIPRSDFVFFSEMKIYVKAANELGEAISEPVVLEPISAAKFDPPSIVKILAGSGCLKVNWSMSQQQTWMKNYKLNLEVRLRAADSGQWPEQLIFRRLVRPAKFVSQCSLPSGTEYQAQVRVRYKQGPWSEWSRSQSGVTLESAPTGRLDWWMKVSGDPVNKQLNVNLFWKWSKQFRANGRNVSYVVSMQKAASAKGRVCSTAESYCTFQLPWTAKKKVYLSAVNAAGRSNPTEAQIYLPKAQRLVSVDRRAIMDVSAQAQNDEHLLVQWRSLPYPDLKDIVVEWRPLLKTGLSFTHFEITEPNQTSLIIKDHFDAYKPYRISVYPRFKNGPGVPQSDTTFLKEKAPSMVPKIQIKKTQKSNIDLMWKEIPLEQRNGIIESYKIFYWHKEGPVKVVNADLSERRVVLKELGAQRQYEAFLSVSTRGGSLNGTTIQFNVDANTIDAVTIVMIVTASGVSLSLLIITMVMICFSKEKWLKGHFWPTVPDPANSSMKRWTSESTQATHLDLEWEEPNPVYLSHLSLLDVPVKSTKLEEDLWLSSAEDTSNHGESPCGSPFIPAYSGSNSGSVPYATVVFSSPCNSPIAKMPNVYLRSESTQPLLEAEESFTPKCYQSMEKDVAPCEQCFFGPSVEHIPRDDIVWDNFPFLQALSINEEQGY